MRFASDERGSVMVMAAFSLTMMLGVAAIGLDLGLLYNVKRKDQGAVDLAALNAASDIKQAEAAARKSLSDNRYDQAQDITVLVGTYARRNDGSPAGQFVAGGASPNAVRVSMTTAKPTIFARMIGWASTLNVGVTSTAVTTRFASFSLGSGVASLNAGIANALLGSMLGTNLSLSVLDYDALQSTHVDALRFLDSLATKINLQAASYNDLLVASARPSEILSALASTAPAGAASDALRRLSLVANGDARRIQVNQFLDLGDAATLSMARGSQGPTIETLATVSALASIANGERIATADLGATIPGLPKLRISTRVGQRRQSSGWVAVGSPKAILRAAQVRVLLEAEISAPLNLGSLLLPIYAETGYAQATLKSVSCPAGSTRQRTMDLDVQPGLFSLALADISASNLATDNTPPGVDRPATLLSLKLPPLSIRAKASVKTGSPRTQTVSFNEDDIARNRPRTVVSTDMIGSTVGTLMSNTDLDINGTSVVPLTALRPLLTATLSAAAAPLDLVLDSTLRALGMRLGSATVTAEGARCEQAVLVQ